MGSHESDVYEATRSFLAAMQGLQKVFRFDTRVFAQAVDEITFSSRVTHKFIGEHPEAAHELAKHYLERLNHANYQVR
jgi:hypothetical protein